MAASNARWCVASQTNWCLVLSSGRSESNFSEMLSVKDAIWFTKPKNERRSVKLRDVGNLLIASVSGGSVLYPSAETMKPANDTLGCANVVHDPTITVEARECLIHSSVTVLTDRGDPEGCTEIFEPPERGYESGQSLALWTGGTLMIPLHCIERSEDLRLSGRYRRHTFSRRG